MAFPSYGGRGIKFRFASFDEWLRELGPKPSAAYSVERRDNNGDYVRGNIIWATRSQQQRNKRKRAWRIDPHRSTLRTRRWYTDHRQDAWWPMQGSYP